jgi:hypothetical protein
MKTAITLLGLIFCFPMSMHSFENRYIVESKIY